MCLWVVVVVGVVDHSNADNWKYKDHRLFQIGPLHPVTIETEISLASKYQPVAIGTMKTGLPGDQ